MKKIFGVLAAASLFFSVNAFAQENANRDANGNVVRGPYETNDFKDNIFAGAGLGFNSGLNFGNGGTIPWITFPGLGLDAYAGKWLTPDYGLRLAYHGLTNQSNLKPFDLFNNWENFLFLDILFNLSSIIDGYQETREWTWTAFPTAGLSLYNGDPAWILGLGAQVKKYAFLGNENLGMIIEARLNAAPDSDGFHWNTDGGFLSQISFPASITWGVEYDLSHLWGGKSGFKRSASIVPAVVPVPFTTQQYEDLSGKVAELEKENKDLKNKIAALEKDNEDLRNKLASGQNYVYEEGKFVVVDSAAGSKTTLYFDCGSTTLTAREKAHFEYFAEAFVNADSKLKVDGYADKQTGSAKRNQYLSEQRVKTVIDLLKKAGANEANIESAAHGASVQPFDNAAKNRVVTVEIVK